jgi:hypothetical protein
MILLNLGQDRYNAHANADQKVENYEELVQSTALALKRWIYKIAILIPLYSQMSNKFK